MRSHAKASSAGSSTRQAKGLGRIFRGDVAIRGALRDASGNGAPAGGRARASALAVTVGALALLCAAPTAIASKGAIGWTGTARLQEGATFVSQGGSFATPAGVAVNATGAGGVSPGDFYVADSGNNRIQEFHANGEFVRTWGQDVIGVNEIQYFSLKDLTGGTYTLSFKGKTTAPLPYNAKEDEISPALEALSTIGAGNVAVSGFNLSEPRVIRFRGALEGTDEPQITVDSSSLQGEPATITVKTLVDGFGGVGNHGYEICEEALHCNEGRGSVSPAPGGEMSGPAGIAVDQSTGAVYVTERNFPRVQKFSATGQFEAAFGKDVIQSGHAGDTGTATEVCTVAADCQAGSTGELGGEFESPGFFAKRAIAVAPAGSPSAGHVYVTDPGNRRVQEFTSTGAFVETFGADVQSPAGGTAFEVCTVASECKAAASGGNANGQFASSSPSSIAVDDAGRIYAIDGGNSRVQRFTAAPAFDTVYGATQLSGSPAPMNIAIDPGANAGTGEGADDHVFVTKACNPTLCPEGSLPPPFSTNEVRIKELGTEADPALIDTHMAGDGISTAQDLAVNTSTNRLYVGVDGFPGRVYFIDNPLSAPGASVGTPSTVGDTTATLAGSVDPKGGNVTCKFQYSSDQSVWIDAQVPGKCESLENGGGPQAVSAEVSGLVPNTRYFVRLVVSRPFPPASSTTSAPQPFETEAPAPVISLVGAVEIADTSVRLTATIDPKHSETGYVFEYGTTPALGAVTPPLNIGNGSTPLTISQVVSNLSPDTTYYYRLVATNLTGTTTSSGHSLHTRATPLPLPDNRAYEMVSPPDKNGGDADHPVENAVPVAGIAVNGEAVGFCTQALFGDPPPQLAGSICAPYVSRRSASGWQTATTVPHYCRTDPDTTGLQLDFVSQYVDDNFETGVLGRSEPASCPLGPLDPSAPPTGGLGITYRQGNLYRQDMAGDPQSPQSYQLIAPKTPLGFGFAGGDSDFSHIVYVSEENESEPPDSPAPGAFSKVYDWEEDGEDGCTEPAGCIQLVSRDTNNQPFTTPSNFVYRHRSEFGMRFATDGVSQDGSHIFFYNPAAAGKEYADSGSVLGVPDEFASTCGGCDLFMREDGATTYKVSESECTADCGIGRDESSTEFEDATPSGEVALFLSCRKLTDASSPASEPCSGVSSGFTESFGAAKLYRWDRNAAPGHRLIDLTADHEPADGLKPEAREVLGMSNDGNTVYFATNGDQLVAGAPVGSGFKLYRWRWNDGNPTVDFLAALSSTYFNLYENIQDPKRRVTPDGRYLLLETEDRLTPAADHDSSVDVYRWDEEDGWLCVSCQEPGVSSMGNSSAGGPGISTLYTKGLSVGGSVIKAGAGAALTPRISDDGKRIFFTTPDALVPQDVNAEGGCTTAAFPRSLSHQPPLFYTCSDVYEWNDGRVSLVSAGNQHTPSYLIGMDASGRDALFFTRQKLVGWDVDDNVDIYDARVGGGFPEPAPQPPSCEGESCRGGGSVPPVGAGAGTAVFQGPGNPTPKHGKATKRHKKHRKHGRHHKRAAKHNRRAAR